MSMNLLLLFEMNNYFSSVRFLCIVPKYKTGNETDYSNYQGISWV
jgi:hypothetical protein